MMNRRKYTILLSMFCLVLVSSCKKDEEPEDPIIPNEEEVITTLIYTLTPEAGGDDIIFSFQDLDGDGGNEPILEEGILTANTSYTGRVQLLNEQESPAEDITLEVEEEGEDHQFFFIDSDSDVTVTYSDTDASGNPIGIESTLTTNDTNIGTLTIVLRHEPNKAGEGVTGGDITNAGGETDIEVTFNVAIE